MHPMDLITRYGVLALAVIFTALFLVLGAIHHPGWYVGLAIAGPLALLGIWHLLQRKHTLLRNYPIVGLFRWSFEEARPFLRQYIVEGDLTGRPLNRHTRSLVYERSKNMEDVQPFGTLLDAYSSEYEFVSHSIAPRTPITELFRLSIGGEDCARPYSASILNISAMSFGALGANAVEALNLGARKGNFFHDTGEGAISRYHRKHGGDLVYEIGTGYFGCRTAQGKFDPERFRDQAADDQVKMVEIKLSQGAKPGHGGLLPGAKVTPEIAEARGVPVGVDCQSPHGHSAFSTPVEMMEFIAQLRELSGGKPVGFKLCIGHPWEVLALTKAMKKTGILPDFIVVDGAEGGTGAAPKEFTDHVGTPLREGLIIMRNALVGTGLRPKIRLAASGKITSGFTLASNLAIGADWCNSARGFMLALGCVMSMRCHTGKCPTGVTTHDPARQRGLVIPLKAERVAEYHRQTVLALAEIVAAAGIEHPQDLRPAHIHHRVSPVEVRTMEEIYTFLKEGELDAAPQDTIYADHWAAADPDSFSPRVDVGAGRANHGAGRRA